MVPVVVLHLIIDHLSLSSSFFCCHLHLPTAVPEAHCPHIISHFFLCGLVVAIMVPACRCCHHFFSMCVQTSSIFFFFFSLFASIRFSTVQILQQYSIRLLYLHSEYFLTLLLAMYLQNLSHNISCCK